MMNHNISVHVCDCVGKWSVQYLPFVLIHTTKQKVVELGTCAVSYILVQAWHMDCSI